MREALVKRLDQLQAQVAAIAQPHREWPGSVGDDAAAQAWITSAANIARALCPADSVYVSEMHKLTVDQEAKHDIGISQVHKISGVLAAIKTDVEAGLLRRVEDMAFAAAFDDFLDHAVAFHRDGRAKEAAVLVSAVLEDAIKRIAKKFSVPHSGQTIDPLVDALVKANVFTPIKAKRVKAYAGVRNAALHAEWDKVDSKDVGEAIAGVRELLDQFLAE